MRTVDLSNRLNSAIIFHVNIINWDVVHVELSLRVYVRQDFAGDF